MLSHTIKAGTIKAGIAGAILSLALAAGAAQAAPAAASVDGARSVAGSMTSPVEQARWRHRHHRHGHCHPIFLRRCGYYLNACRIVPSCRRH